MRNAYRIERDALGEVHVPTARYFGAQTARALENFRISGTRISSMPELVRALAWVKKAAALANLDCGGLDKRVAGVILKACDEIIKGDLMEEFCVDVLQGGAGTSTNMNANEVIANRALEHLGCERGAYEHVHPNDHVNRSQSTNDSYATAVRLTACQLCDSLEHAIGNVVASLRTKANEFRHIQKLGRTQMQDAVPMSAGDEFDAFAETLSEDIARIQDIKVLFLEVNLGGTAIGTGVGAGADYQSNVVSMLAEVTGLAVRPARNRIEASSDMGAFVTFSGLLKRFAIKLSKICNDLRLLASGPIGGLGELILPERQPGSSLMPGKINPVIPEVVNQVCFKVIGADTAVSFAAEAGQLQLNAMEPLILHSIHESCTLLTAAMDSLVTNCISDLRVDEDRCRRNLESSGALATYLVPHVGYDRASRIASGALKSDQPFIAYLAALHPELLSLINHK